MVHKNVTHFSFLIFRSNRTITCKTDKHKTLTFLFSLLKQMPEPNVLLVRHLLSVLHKIKSRASVNHMTAYALSVLIAPSMLWNYTPLKSEFGNDLSQKASGPPFFSALGKRDLIVTQKPRTMLTIPLLLKDATLVVLTSFKEVWKGVW